MTIDPTSDPRLAGGLRRYHAWPILVPQTVAEHSWQVARILLAIWPDCDRRLVVAALLHDVGEWGGPGDVPFLAKRASPTLAREAGRMEVDAHLSMCLPWSLPGPAILSVLEQRVLKVADLLEMWEKGQEEVLLGNRFAELVVERTRDAALKLLSWPGNTDEEAPVMANVAHRTRTYMQRRESAWRTK